MNLATGALQLCGLAGELALAPVHRRPELWQRAKQLLDALSPLVREPELTQHERAVLKALEIAAENDAPCPTADDLLEYIDFGSQSTTVAIIKRLESRGIIGVERYQRGRRVTILATGKATRKPSNAAPHWRDRTQPD